jgi:4-amino-4-deoxy-L-arabinose transferase-like glycosyltransferase
VPDAWIDAVLVALAALAIATFAIVAFLRLGFPFELEWMEGSSIAHLDRVVHGLPLYVKPSIDFTPFIYPPLYFVVASWVAKLTGVGFVPLRLVSILASLATMALLFGTVHRESRSRVAGLLAAGLYAACYRQGGAWLDIGRTDSLSLCLTLAGYAALRHLPSRWIGGAAGGVLMGLAALTKQSALFIAAPLAVATIATHPRRGITYAATLGAVFGGAVAILNRQSGGWFDFYVFELPKHHPIIGQLLRGFWIEDFLGPLALAMVFGSVYFFAPPVRARWRWLVVDAAFIGALIVAGYATRVRVGSYVNVVLPAYLGVALLFGLGVAALATRRSAEPAARLAARWLLLLCITQFAVLAYKPWKQIPPARDRVAGEQIVASLKAVQGDVWVPRHPYLGAMAGKPWHAHELALQDVLRREELPQQHAFAEELHQAAASRRFAVLVLDDETWVHDEFAPYYKLMAKMFKDDEKDLFFPITGYYTRPGLVYVPATDSTGAAQ